MDGLPIPVRAEKLLWESVAGEPLETGVTALTEEHCLLIPGQAVFCKSGWPTGPLRAVSYIAPWAPFWPEIPALTHICLSLRTLSLLCLSLIVQQTARLPSYWNTTLRYLIALAHSPLPLPPDALRRPLHSLLLLALTAPICHALLDTPLGCS